MSVTATVKLQISVRETLTTGVAAITDPTLNMDGFNSTSRLTSTTTPPVTKVYAASVALVAGAKTIDLTSLVGTGGASLTMLGLKLQSLKIQNPAGNAVMSFTKGASDGYQLFKHADGLIQLAGGEEACFLYNDTLDDVAAADKNIDVAGTGTQSFNILMVFG
jgi:hypothetical protein